MAYGEDGDGGTWRKVRALLRPLLGELLGTALLVLLGVASLLPVHKGEMRPLTHPALGFGFVVTALVTALGPVSGAHMNPAVTLAALLLGQLGALPALLYALAQLLGGALGFGVLVGTLPPHALRTLDSAGAVLGVHGCPAPAPGVPVWAAALVEALLTGLLVLVVCAVWAAHDAARPDHSVPLKLGVTIAGLVYAGGPITGASLNPARSLGPALWLNFWTDHWVYWVGPLGGAALAALLHRWALALPRAPPRPAEELPLRDKFDH